MSAGEEKIMRFAMSRRRGAVSIAVLGLLSFAATARATPVNNQVNDFEAGTTQGWTNGGGATDPTNVTTGGPGGANDNFLRVSARGGSGAGSRLTSYNRASQWVGNYVTAGVTSVEMDLKNLGTTPLVMRVGLQETGNTRYVTTVPFNLPSDGLWHHAAFPLNPTSLTRIGSTAVATGLTRVSELRIIHSTAADFMGDPIASSFGVDNVRAVPEPGISCLVGSCAAGLLLRRRR
jgi:hypothetical protein